MKLGVQIWGKQLDMFVGFSGSNLAALGSKAPWCLIMDLGKHL